jgi:hypothetical protein
VLLFVLAFLPPRVPARWAAAGGALTMAATLAVSIAVIFGPNSDASYHETNWASHGYHALYVGLLIGEAAAAALLALLAIRTPAPAVVRLVLVSCGIASVAVLLVLVQAVSN